MGEMPKLSYQRTDDEGTSYREQWLCDPPPEPDVAYQVIRSEWNEDFTVRTILEIKLV